MKAEASDDRLRWMIERVERLEEEKKGIGDDIRDVYGEAKAVGYDVKIMRQIVRLRKMKPDDRREMEMVLETYKAALGMSFESTPLGQVMAERDAATEDRPADMADGPKGPTIQTEGDPPGHLDHARLLVLEHGKASISWLQRQLRIRYNSAARLIEQLEREGVVSAPNHVGVRTVAVPDAAAVEAITSPAVH